MSANTEKPAVQMPTSDVPDFLKTNAIEEDIEKLQFRGPVRSASVTRLDETKSPERLYNEKSRAAIESCTKTGQVMKVLFPQGVQLKNEDEFAVFRLFDRLVGDIVQFANTGMQRPASLRDLSLQAMLLETVIASREKQ
jgi:hypothetical protein